MLSVLVHPNLDICKLGVTLLYELCEEELIASHKLTVTKVIQRFSENSIWSLLVRVMQGVRAEKKAKGDKVVSERSEEDLLEQKCLNLLQNILEFDAELISAKMMHSDAFIQFLLESMD